MHRVPEWCWWITSIIGVLILGVLTSWWLWDELRQYPRETLSTTFRNLALIIGGVMALLLAVWRSRVSERQSLASQQQAATAQQSLLNERYERGAEMLGSEVLSVRMGGIYALQKLAEEHPDQYHVQIIRLLCAFVRNPAGVDNTPRTEKGRRYPKLRDDVQASYGGHRSSEKLRVGECDGQLQPRLVWCASLVTGIEQGKLAWSDLTNANLEGAKLPEADLFAANLSGANMCRAYLSEANLSGANLHGQPNLSWATIMHADLSKSRIGPADFSHAQLTHTNLSGANITATDFSDASLFYTNLSGVTFGESTRTTLSDPPVSEKLYVRLTQAQLDEAAAEPGDAPKIHELTTDIETGEPLIWQGRRPLDLGQ